MIAVEGYSLAEGNDRVRGATEGQCQGGGGTDIYPDGGGGYVILYICQTQRNCLAQKE